MNFLHDISSRLFESPFRLEAVMGNEKTSCIGAEAVSLRRTIKIAEQTLF